METAIAWGLAGLPFLIYLGFAASYFLGSRSRRRDHVVRLMGVPRVHTFYVKTSRVSATSPEEAADQMLPRSREHVMPLVLCGIVTFPVSVAAVSAAKLPLGLPTTVAAVASAVPVDVLAGFAGAYLWGLYACIERFRVANWTPSFIHGLWVRILIGGMLGGLVGVPFKAEYSPLLAFSLGAFPSDTVRKWLRRRAAKAVGLEEDDVAAGPKWAAIQGVTTELLDRLEEADVESPTALANADPVQLLLRTNIPWRHILDLIDQAILATYVGPKLEAVRIMGVRGAIEMALLGERLRLLKSDDPIRQDADRTVARIAAILGEPDSGTTTRNLIQNLDEDAQVELIWNLWFEEPAKGVLVTPAFGVQPTAPEQAARAAS